MLTYNEAFYGLKKKLLPLYDEREAAAIAHELMQHTTGLDKTQRLLQKGTLFTAQQQEQYEQMSAELASGKPLQYVTGHTWFLGREFYVNEHVLIPRPETEELVKLVESSEWKAESHKGNKIILDAGTGSGCIAVSLKLALREAEIWGCDVSSDALAVARENAERLGADVMFVQLDFLNAHERNELGRYDVIVSNPPYIPESERANIHTNVRDYEPGIALFVPDNDALVFYRAIAEFGKEHLNANGYIYCELDAGHAMDCKALFEASGYEDVEVRKDMHGHWRMLKARIKL